MTITTTPFFELHKTKLLNRWGDYGQILANGIPQTENDVFQRLDRVGPFVPPISFPSFGNVVVTNETRRRLESYGLSGVGEFRPVSLGKVVLIDWHKWDKSRRLEPHQIPFNGEPEEYILHNPHDAATAAKLELLWSWHPLQIGTVLRENGVLRLKGIIGTHDVFRLIDNGWKTIFVNEKGRQCIEDICGDWVTFQQVKEEVLS
jgi:hypothetical protein